MTTKALMTADDLLKLPRDNYKYELVQGELIKMSPTGARHGQLAVRIARALGDYVEKRHLGVVCAAETGFKLFTNPDTVRAPDASFVSARRIPGGQVPESFWPLAPDLAVEVISPTDRFAEIQTKVKEYLDAGTRVVWVVDPKTRTVTVYRSLEDVAVLTEKHVLKGDPVLPQFSLPLQKLFA
ncbi:MAG: Uma2 family endonuclease [Acidobacteria bacterium]|nr:Uma2 family endonuclease [Acidobacteriota bacterium]